MEFRDYYDILGVARGATQDEIKKAFRQKSRLYHPDVSKEENAEDKFKQVGEAYEVLKDPETRNRYDMLGANYKHGQNVNPPPGWQGYDFGQGGGGFGGGAPGGAGTGAGVVKGLGGTGDGAGAGVIKGLGGTGDSADTFFFSSSLVFFSSSFVNLLRVKYGISLTLILLYSVI